MILRRRKRSEADWLALYYQSQVTVELFNHLAEQARSEGE